MGSRLSSDTDSSRALILDFPVSRIVKKCISIIEKPLSWGHKELDITERLTLSLHFQSMVFCSSSLNGVKELIGLITRFFH